MQTTYHYPVYQYRAPPELQGAPGERRAVAVVGAGPIGISAAIDLALHDVSVVLLDDDNTVSAGSRAICFAKRTLEIFDRLGCGEPMVDKGVTWNVGKVFFKNKQIYNFNLLPESGHRRPAFINLQQYYLEEYLVRRAQALKRIDLRWNNKVIGIEQRSDHVTLQVETPDGIYGLECEYLIVADGARSPLRKMLGLESKGQVFRDRFLIADIVMKADFPTERWFWFDPPFHKGQSTLLHKQPDNVWRIDFQLGWDADPDEEKKPERVIPRLKAMLGDDVEFELEWCSVYTFTCRRMDKFRHGRVFFTGDAAHQVSPFGARGANGGVQDTDNLVWKLALVLAGLASEKLLNSYDAERIPAADENILNSTRSTDFITPKSEVSRLFRDATLELAEDCPFARALVNSGRLSVPYVLHDSCLNTPDEACFQSAIKPGAPCADAPITIAGESAWLLSQLGGEFCGLYFGDPTQQADIVKNLQALVNQPIPIRPILVTTEAVAEFINIQDSEGLVAERYDGQPGTFYLIRPDQHVAARWRRFDPAKVVAALARATARKE